MQKIWTKWRGVNQIAEHAGPAVYNIRMALGKKPIPIQRFLGSDRQGILAIGKTINMEKRRKQFISGLSKGRGHSEGNLVFLLEKYSRLKRAYRGYSLEYRFITADDKGSAEDLERDLIKKYVKQYGEAPPLNSSVPGRYDEKSWREA
jgi:hypothetical protein